MTKETEIEDISSDESLKILTASLLKDYGEGIIIPGSNIIEKPKKKVSISPCIDVSLGGGIYEGSWAGFAGAPGVGKTTIVLQIAKNAQLDGRPVFYLNVEARLKKMNLEGIKGLDPSKVNVINYVENKNLSGEDFLNIAERIIKTVKNAVIIIDSVSSLCPSGEMEQATTGSIRPTTPKMLSHFIKKNTGSVYINNIIVLMIHHVITNTSGYGAKWQISDGVKVNFQADVRLQAKGNPTDWKEGELQVGQIVEWELGKSNDSASVGTTRSFIRYGVGVDESAEIFNLCVDFGVIKKKGAWYECSILSDNKSEKSFQLQGQEKFLRYLNENEDKMKILKNKLMEFVT